MASNTEVLRSARKWGDAHASVGLLECLQVLRRMLFGNNLLLERANPP